MGHDDTALVSVVMPAYNAAETLEEAVSSVLAQSMDKLELLIINDASTDATGQILNRLASSDTRIRVITQAHNSGVAAARNTAIQQARGQWIALLDSDDTWEPTKLEEQLKLAHAEKADLVYCSYDFITSNPSKSPTPFLVPATTSYNEMLTKCAIQASTVLVKTELMQDHPFSTTFYHEDYLLWMQLFRIPIKAVGCTQVLMHYRLRDDSRSADKLKAARNRWVIYRHALNMNIVSSVKAFIGYAWNGVKKYYT